MQKNKTTLIVVFIVILLVLLAIIYFVTRSNTNSNTENTNTTTDTIVSTDEKEAIFPVLEQNGSNQNGTIWLQEIEGKVKVTLSLNLTAESSQPAHIHIGSCPNPGDVVYPLTNVIAGISETTINTTLSELRDMDSLAVNIHKSANESSVYTACGDLNL